MISRKHWDVLIVDDEPDVLAVTKLALRGVTIYSIPLKLHTCSSSAEAIEFLKRSAKVPSNLATVLLDVVMESDHAGLDVAKYIRETHENYITPIVLRTGQAGKAPEKSVIDRYEISTYVTKQEATEDRLYTLVKSGVRQFLWARNTQGAFGVISYLIAEAADRESFLRKIHEITLMMGTDEGESLDSLKAVNGLLLDNHWISPSDRYGSSDEARARIDEIMRTSEPSRVQGGKVFVSGRETLLALDRDGGQKPELYYLTEHRFDPIPQYMLEVLSLSMGCIQNLWMRFR